ncbi:MAG: ankyrin repeat protein [Flavobacteriaceae bacterium]|jgi:ankyrin repeat protein
MEDFKYAIDNEHWGKALEFISKDKSLISKIPIDDIANELIRYALVENGIEEHVPPFGKYSDLKKLSDLCIDSGMKGKSLPHSTAFRDLTQIDSLLLKGHKIDEIDHFERTALMVASALNDIDLVQFIIDKKADISFTDYEGMEAIDLTISLEIIELLKLKGGKTKQEHEKEDEEMYRGIYEWNFERDIRFIIFEGIKTGYIKLMEEALKESYVIYSDSSWASKKYAPDNNNKIDFDSLSLDSDGIFSDGISLVMFHYFKPLK